MMMMKDDEEKTARETVRKKNKDKINRMVKCNKNQDKEEKKKVRLKKVKIKEEMTEKRYMER